ncbi:MAG: stage II sporulation protein P [Syntrophomonadaceae bacterium]|jgi:stage II sporulation protein P|nr:stage II sporulation protein P [Bacillota bacterium]HQA50646.1 stage II sporulation protein P [Syntrophomonadaceae bacterium]HQD91171.1 stage II sporulation protein P [Syntrophomonadaceae bacterium]
MMNKWYVAILIALLGVLCVPSAVLGQQEEAPRGKYYTLVDENNNIVHQTAIKVYPGDEYISSDNSRYKVVEVVGETARCVYQGEERMPVLNYNPEKKAWIFQEHSIPVETQKKPTIAIYHTHSDESYIKGDGKESIEGNGGIYDIGKIFADRLRQLGFEVIYSDNNHNPHDINAYNRSRRTAMQLIKESTPDVVVDIHRDAVPADQYQTEVKGQDATKIKLVVGRTNPNMKANLDFAKQIKAAMDKQTPGLSNGIFMGKGDYNQDLSPRVTLIEVGSHTNSKDEAEKGAKLFASTIPVVLGVPVEGQEAAAKPLTGGSGGAGTAILIILVVVGAAAAGYYFLNKGAQPR